MFSIILHSGNSANGKRFVVWSVSKNTGKAAGAPNATVLARCRVPQRAMKSSYETIAPKIIATIVDMITVSAQKANVFLAPMIR